MEAIFPAKRAHRLVRRDCRCTVVSMSAKHWICLFPQHGPGRKHVRHTELADWQREIVADFTGLPLRGLIHRDGCRIVVREVRSGHVRNAPRYLFSNLSENIKEIFCEACDALDIRWTRPNHKTIAVYRLASAERLDEFVGVKR